MSKDGSTVQCWEHRIVLFDQIGFGPHRCYWCGKCINWGHGLTPVSLTVDHIDGNSRNNDPANLKPSCHSCNSHRPAKVADDEVFVERQGKRIRAVEKVCERCGKEFRVPLGTAKNPRQGRFCSRACIFAPSQHR